MTAYCKLGTVKECGISLVLTKASCPSQPSLKLSAMVISGLFCDLVGPAQEGVLQHVLPSRLLAGNEFRVKV